MHSRPALVEELIGIADAGIDAADGAAAVRAACDRPEIAALLANASRVFGVAVGKAAPEMHAGLRSRIGASWGGGIVVSHRPGRSVAGAAYRAGDHPVPGPASVAAGEAVLEFLAESGLRADDLVVVSVSGGTSSLMAVPVAGIGLDDLAAVSGVLVRSGAGIGEVNAVRRLLSRTHNGAIAEAAAPARVLGLVMNDTPGASPDDVGSGPTYPRRHLSAAAAAMLGEHLGEPRRTRVLAAIGAAPPPAADPAVRNVQVVGSGEAVGACVRSAELAGFRCVVLPDVVADAAAAALRMAGELRGAKPRLVVGAGEVSVRVSGPGRGGRCQQLAWEMMPYLADLPGSAFVAVATDGRDHLPGVGGAWSSEASLAAVRGAVLSWQTIGASHDSHRGLATIGNLFPERHTGTNVADLYLAAVR